MSAPRIINPATASGGVPVGGSGAQGYVAKWTAATTLGGGTTTGATASLYVDATGNVGIGTASPSSLGTNYTTLDIRGSAGGGIRAGTPSIMSYMYADTSGWNVATSTALPIIFYTNNIERARIDSTGNFILGAATGVSIQAAGTNQGLKLATTPGNTDPNTLDCYLENTWAPTLTGFGGTAPTVTAARYTRIGRLVSLQLHLSAVPATTFSSVAGSTFVSLPAGMTPPVSAPGATSNSGIAADGPCVAYTNGNFYLPTFALRSADTFLNVTYTV